MYGFLYGFFRPPRFGLVDQSPKWDILDYLKNMSIEEEEKIFEV